jgi:predicted lipoprotein with Yx(FWY)xxD motif
VLPGPVERVSGFYRWAEDGTPLYRRWDQQEWERMER